MSAPPSKLATYADLLALPEDARAEIIGGQVVTAPSPLPTHGRTQLTLGRFIGGPYDQDDGHGGPGGWWIFAEVDIQLSPHDVVRPDLCGFRRARLTSPGHTRPLTVVPDWVCEILSPSTTKHDRVTKRALYAKSGIPHYWIVDTEARVLEAFKLVDGQWMITGSYGDEDNARIEPFEEIELPVGRLFMPVEE
jgi:Uma2 family endonuclease